MQIIRYVHDGHVRNGVLREQEVLELDWELRDLFVLAAAGRIAGLEPFGAPVPLTQVDLLPPIEPTARILCAGINYAEHQAESADVFSPEVPTEPIVFSKTYSALCGAAADLPLPSDLSTEFDYEVELGVVIGAPARDVPIAHAWDVVAGFTVVNDVTARDVQVAHSQWTLGKNTERATPVGPCVLTVDEVGAEAQFDIELAVNGTIKQSASTADMIFGVPELIATISRALPLQPGDLIATGTPSGVGFKRQPPEFLGDGDRVVARIPGIGALDNRVRLRSGNTAGRSA